MNEMFVSQKKNRESPIWRFPNTLKTKKIIFRCLIVEV